MRHKNDKGVKKPEKQAFPGLDLQDCFLSRLSDSVLKIPYFTVCQKGGMRNVFTNI